MKIVLNQREVYQAVADYVFKHNPHLADKTLKTVVVLVGDPKAACGWSVRGEAEPQ